MRTHQIPFWAGMYIMIIAGMHSASAQNKPDIPDIRIHTVMERYEPEMVLSPRERLRLKRLRRQEVERREAVIDTLDVSPRMKRRLLRELYQTPFTDKYEEVLNSLEASGEDDTH